MNRLFIKITTPLFALFMSCNSSAALIEGFDWYYTETSTSETAHLSVTFDPIDDAITFGTNDLTHFTAQLIFSAGISNLDQYYFTIDYIDIYSEGPGTQGLMAISAKNAMGQHIFNNFNTDLWVFSSYIPALHYVSSGYEARVATSPAPPPISSVPEPTAISLLILGLAGIGFSRRRS